ncbi:uncharacterized protein LOC127877985 isoform X1 [Dreissena polymorpha]|uniref:TRAF-type domain-containing protein n=1 Tax=Dreissena polymorpha TaxID=45954 RepID=A0A9D4KQ44_DREPO|nr:uncharacterized protein LOC127877985 isoform X1 [Dreissena polymorpha]XP_052280290.1 uncharacterized protein LOC127877985 isoform X1 [Dreissena polymorpha]KAH3843633.1 hypothetical protein DPMN_117158 [Dreissena polymorpha]
MMPPKASKSTCKRGQKNDIYLLYDEDDSSRVMEFAEQFRQFYKVFDPHTDGVPGESKLWSWLEKGIYNSKMTVVFFSKKSITKEAYIQLSHAIREHRIIAIMVQSCKIPKILGHFNIVYAYHTDSFDLTLNHIRQAIEAPKETFKRLDFPYHNPGKVTQTVVGIPKFENRTLQETPRKTTKITVLDVILNAHIVCNVFNNFTLRCDKPECTFKCRANNFQEVHAHTRSCKFEWVQCSYCKQKVFRKNMQKHEQRKCRFRRLKCSNEGCVYLTSLCDVESHKRSCVYQLVNCRNSINGCKAVHLKKDANQHKRKCDYETLMCNLCKLFKLDFDSHHCQNSDKRTYIFSCENTGCIYEGSANDMIGHNLVCEFRKQTCRHCSRLIPVGMLTAHTQECSDLTSCHQCGVTIPRYLLERHRQISCGVGAMTTVCDTCYSIVDEVSMKTHTNNDCINYKRHFSMQNTAPNANTNAKEPKHQSEEVSQLVPIVRRKQRGRRLSTIMRLRGRDSCGNSDNSKVSSHYVNFEDHQKLGIMTPERRDWFNSIGNPASPCSSESGDSLPSPFYTEGLCHSSSWYNLT